MTLAELQHEGKMQLQMSTARELIYKHVCGTLHLITPDMAPAHLIQ